MRYEGLDFRFAGRPRWLLGHVIALVAIVTFTSLGLWQLRRHDDRAQLNATIEQRIDDAPVNITELLAGVDDLDAIEYRRAEATGVFETSEEVILQNRSLNGVSGHHVLTPLVFDDGSAVIVERGWVPIDASGPPVAEASPPTGRVTVTGIVRLTQTRGSFGPVDPPTGTLERISRVDVERLRLQSDHRLAPVFLQLVDSQPAGGELPLVPPEPEIEPGPHLSYAVQWFVFAGVVLVGYPVLMVRTAQRSRSSSKPRR